jgi:hypothetical protein
LAYAKQMAPQEKAGSSDSDDEPRRGDAQDLRRKGPSPSKPPLEGHRTPPKGSFDFTARGGQPEDIRTRRNGAD